MQNMQLDQQKRVVQKENVESKPTREVFPKSEASVERFVEMTARAYKNPVYSQDFLYWNKG